MSAVPDTGVESGSPAGAAVWMLRINPLRRVRLADPELTGALEELCQLEQELARAAEVCSEALYERIGTAPQVDRAALVALRRDVHNDRMPTRLPQNPDAPIERWLEVRVRRGHALALVVDRYPRAIAAERRTVDRLLGEEDLRSALALVAPEVHDAARRYLAGGTAQARKSERGLLQYLARAVMRTSPLSRFTAVGLAVEGSDGTPLDDVTFPGARAVVGIDRAMLGYVLGGLANAGREPELDTWVRQVPGLAFVTGPERLTFVVEGQDGPRSVALGLSPAVSLLVESTAMGPRRLAAVAADLARELNLPPSLAIGQVIAGIRAGFLCIASGSEDCAEDPAKGAVARQPEAEPLHVIGELLADLATGPAEKRAVGLADLRSASQQLGQAAGRRAGLTVVEDYHLRPLRVSTKGHMGQLTDLAGAVEFLSVFDRLHDVRANLTQAFVERFGRGASVPLVRHARGLVREVYRLDVVGSDAVADLRILRAHILEVLRSDLARLPDAEAEVVWSVRELAAMADLLPQRCRSAPLSYGVLIQAVGDLMIYNDAYAGHGMLYGRFLEADSQDGGRAGEHLRERLVRRYGSDGHKVAEDRGLHRLNVNAHPQVLEHGLLAEDWYRVRLVHDPEQNRLDLVDDDGRLRVLTLGTGHPEMYPPPLRIANWLVSGGRLHPELGLTGGLAGVGPDGSRPVPRLRAGSVVLQRRRWPVNDDLRRALERPEDAAERLIALTRWRARYDVSAEVVLKTATDWDQRRSAAPAARPRVPDTRGKPQYVDLAGAVLTRALPRFLDRRPESYVEEALPTVGSSPYAAEWAVEISRSAGGRFEHERWIR